MGDDAINRGLDALGYDADGRYDPKRDPYSPDAEARRQLDGRGKGKTSRGSRTLPPLPDHGAALGDLRAWSTEGLHPPDGYRVEEFIRAGRQRKDPCTLVLSTPDGGRVRFRFPEQRELSTAGSLRATVHSVTDGLCRVPALSKTELEDVWAVLCSLAKVMVDQDDRDEARDWLEGLVAAADHVNGQTFDRTDGRLDGLTALLDRQRFTRRAAMEMGDPNVDPKDMVRPTLMLDSETGAGWVRAAEVATYVRHVVGAGPISQSTLDARMAEIDVTRHLFEARQGGAHPHAVLYRLTDFRAKGDPEDEK